ncbi:MULTISPECIES: TIGR02647 family protein [Pseudoalteromonas]|uniref:DNA-binding protein n=1 Tax=Pseudoalteromonas ruthenica TaxID=151081 RepID=A0A0F4PPD7_9GAMM|nr:MULTISPECIES: TIGR02647 family protein [Pseudoalteromonas]MCG7543979.1 TIGR02647 family protein [Pseudoalteromonas sp. MM17-2]MCG7559508.1 TIGR02647 family protein [Pseudoalteromonas sp. CNAT2-18.1]MCG7571600.1 TIGR02647 family protein [Pseudoalteromonas sp. CNC9-20]KJY97375.1 DNA-binding protein [Pseudoalteromonas ruthenica]KJY99323.1 DNA-binding protein [Pseudoalteromonas ruthenica]
MRINKTMIDEMELLAKFPRASHMQGIKVHSDADATLRDAAQRLFDKGITDSPDGGYLTDLGLDLVKHLDTLYAALSSKAG